MKDEWNEQWRELSWRRDLTPAERERLRAWLRAHPEARPDWELEAGLTEALRRLPDVAVPTNFTSLVLRAVERETGAERHHGIAWFVWSRRPRWLPRIGFAAILVGAGLISYRHEVLAVQRAAMAQSVATVSGVASLPSPKILKDFEAIRALDQTPPDVELLRLLK
jgi:anti-sigma factor RsiW